MINCIVEAYLDISMAVLIVQIVVADSLKPGKLGHFSLPLEVALLRPLPLFFTQAQPTGRPGHSQIIGWVVLLHGIGLRSKLHQ